MWLDVALVRHRGLELALDDHVGICEACIQVALDELQMRRRVAGVVALGAVHFARVQAVVEQRRAVDHGFADIEDRRQQLVLDVDQLEGVLGDVVVGRGDGCYRVALVEHLGRGDDVVQHPVELCGAFAGVDHLVGGAGEVGVGDHGEYAFERLSLGRVNADDSCVGVRAAQDATGDHAGQVQIRAVLRGAGDLVDTVVPDRSGTDDVVLLGFPGLWLRLCGDHARSPLLWCSTLDGF